VDANLLHSTIWNYTSDNTNETGDNWNGEDLSIFSEGKARGEGGWLRPYPMATAGTPIRFTWDRRKRIFVYCFLSDAGAAAPTEIFLPGPWFGEKPEIRVRRPETASAAPEPLFEYRPAEQRLFILNGGCAGEITVTVRGTA
jgi:hypothetical protein